MTMRESPRHRKEFGHDDNLAMGHIDGIVRRSVAVPLPSFVRLPPPQSPQSFFAGPPAVPLGGVEPRDASGSKRSVDAASFRLGERPPVDEAVIQRGGPPLEHS